MALRKLVAGNWKMNGLRASLPQIVSLVGALRERPAGARVALMPPATLLHAAAALCDGVVEVGAQDLQPEPGGAHTGDLSAEMLRDAGATLVILGHSERRADHGETDAVVAAKVEAALRAGLQPVVCVGETLEERRAGHALDVVRRQLAGSLPGTLAGRAYAVAYEPVWAIGTGETPTPEQIVEVHAAVHEALARTGEAPVLYGGSVKPQNAAQILALAGVDGALVGGASLTADDFLPIVRAAG